jgi:hypothetical protein
MAAEDFYVMLDTSLPPALMCCQVDLAKRFVNETYLSFQAQPQP